MTIEELGDVVGVDLIIRRYAGQDNRYTCSFEGVETKTSHADPCLAGTYGSGKSAQVAVVDYVNSIKGKLLIFGHGTNRKEFGVPNTLTP